MTWTPCSAKAAELLSSFLAIAQWRQEPHHVMLACNQAGGLFDRRRAIAGHTTVPGTDMSAGPCQASYGLGGGAPDTQTHTCGPDTYMWPRYIHVAQIHTCGPDTSMWPRHIHVAQTHTCGPDTYMWPRHIHVAQIPRHIHVAQIHTCGPDTYMWPRYIHVAQIHPCGPDTSMWPRYIHVAQIHTSKDPSMQQALQNLVCQAHINLKGARLTNAKRRPERLVPHACRHAACMNTHSHASARFPFPAVLFWIGHPKLPCCPSGIPYLLSAKHLPTAS